MDNRQATYNYLNIVSFQAVSNWSAASILRNKLLYRPGLRLVKIGDLISRVREKTTIKDEILYKQVTIRNYNKGVVKRKELKGKNIGTKNQCFVRPGQFIMSKIDARNGAFGIVPLELDRAVVTQDFLTYNINTDKILAEFFILLTYSEDFRNLCQQASSGTTGRQRIDEKAFLSFSVPLPEISEQNMLVNAYQEKIELAQRNITEANQIEEDIENYIFLNLGIKKNIESYAKKKIHIINYSSIIYWGVDRILGSESYASKLYETTNLETRPIYYIEIFRGKSPKYDPIGTHFILNQKCNRWNEIDFEYVKPVEDRWYKRIDEKYFTREGDIIINSTGEGTIGRATYITSDYAGWIYDSHMLLLRLNPDMMNPKFLTFLINSSYGQDQIESLKSAKSTKQTELGVKNLMKIIFPVPILEIQDEISSVIYAKKHKIKSLLDQSTQLRKESLSDFERAIFKQTNR